MEKDTINVIVDKTLLRKYNNFHNELNNIKNECASYTHNQVEEFIGKYCDEELSAFNGIYELLSHNVINIINIILTTFLLFFALMKSSANLISILLVCTVVALSVYVLYTNIKDLFTVFCIKKLMKEIEEETNVKN